jgi:hypothetical protein
MMMMGFAVNITGEKTCQRLLGGGKRDMVLDRPVVVLIE